MSAPSGYVLTKGYYGLGGNIAVMACAARVASHLNRKLAIDWRGGRYGDAETNAFDQLFEGPENRLSELLEGVDPEPCLFPAHWQEHYRKPSPHVKGLRLSWDTADEPMRWDSRPNAHADVVVVTRDNALVHQSAFEQEMRSVFERIVPRGDLRERIGAFQRDELTARTIGVHFRHGNGEHTVYPPSRDWFFSAVDRFVSSAGRKAKVFLCTDCSAVVDAFEERYPGKLTHTPKEYLPLGVGGMHYAKTPQDRLRTAEEALIDIWLLSKCKYMVASKSFFSLCATLLSPKRDPAQVARYVPRHRSFQPPAGWTSLAERPEWRDAIAPDGIPVDGLYLEEAEDGTRLWYLHEHLGSFSAPPDARSADRARTKLATFRFY